MLERDLTAQNGEIQKQILPEFLWLRFADTGTRGRSAHKLGFDGLLLFRSRVWVVEVKIGENKKLTENEESLAKLFKKYNINYYILTYYIGIDLWIIRIYDSFLTCSGSLEDICNWLLDL